MPAALAREFLPGGRAKKGSIFWPTAVHLRRVCRVRRWGLRQLQGALAGRSAVLLAAVAVWDVARSTWRARAARTRAALGRDPRRVCGVVEALVNATGLDVWRAALARAPGDASRLYARTIV